MPKKVLQGKVVSTKMEKTIVVSVETIKEHPKYRKKYKSLKRFKAHYEGGDLKEGDVVLIEEVKPISKDKNWVVKI